MTSHDEYRNMWEQPLSSTINVLGPEGTPSDRNFEGSTTPTIQQQEPNTYAPRLSKTTDYNHNISSRPTGGIDTRPGSEGGLPRSQASRSVAATPRVSVRPRPFDEYQPHSGFLDWILSSTDMFFRQLYFNLHLRLPSHYFSRVAMLFENAQVTRKDVNFMIDSITDRRGGTTWDGNQRPVPNPLEKLEKSWDTLIGSLLREWETLNVASVLLLSAILTILQIDQAASYSVTRYTAFASLVCALLSLLYGCLFIMRFGGMKSTNQSVRWASEWAREAANIKISILWNVWVMLALPATFLCWSIISFIACIMSFMWHSALQIHGDGTTVTSNAIPTKTARGLCILITCILFLGLVYLFLIIRTFKKWGERLITWREESEMGYGLQPSPVGGIHIAAPG